MKYQRTRHLINLVKSTFGVRYHLIDLSDEALVYIGSYRSCLRLIHKLGGTIYGVGTYEEVQHIRGIDEQIKHLTEPERYSDDKTHSHQYTDSSFHHTRKAKLHRKGRSTDSTPQHTNGARQ
jgi:hypothetical protein